MFCKLCEKEIDIDDNGDQRAHWRQCSVEQRHNIRRAIKEQIDGPSLDVYNTTYAHLTAETPNGFPYTAYALRVLRMWRANELLGARDYLGQLLNLERYWSDDDKFSFQNSIEHTIVGTLCVLLVPHGESIEAVMAIEDALILNTEYFQDLPKINPGKVPSNHYTFINDTWVPPKDMEFEDEEDYYLAEYEIVDSRLSIQDLAAKFHSKFNWPKRHPMALSKQTLQFQLEVAKVTTGFGKVGEWTDQQDGLLLKLLGEGLPKVELARRLNAEIHALDTYGPVRTEAQVMSRVDELLVFVGPDADQVDIDVPAGREPYPVLQHWLESVLPNLPRK